MRTAHHMGTTLLSASVSIPISSARMGLHQKIVLSAIALTIAVSGDGIEPCLVHGDRRRRFVNKDLARALENGVFPGSP